MKQSSIKFGVFVQYFGYIMYSSVITNIICGHYTHEIIRQTAHYDKVI